MGMAASQARYLGLTARKTNVEYEGQQINQARTALANQSANLFNRLLGLSVPTAPKTTDYTKLQYSFSDGFNDYEIDNFENANVEIDGEKYNYQVTYHYNQNVFKAIQDKNTNPQVQKVTTYNTARNNDNVQVNKTPEGYNVMDTRTGAAGVYKTCTQKDLEELRSLEKQGLITLDNVKEFCVCQLNDEEKIFCKTKDLEKIAQDPTKTGDIEYYQTQQNPYTYMLGNTEAERYDSKDIEQKTAFEQIQHDYPEIFKNIDPEKVWVYEKNGKMYFAAENDLDKCIDDGNKNQPPVKDQYQISSSIDYQSKLNQYYAASINEKITTKEYARLDDASGSGRHSTIKLQNTDGVFQINSEEKTDELSYNDAMNQYSYDILKYEEELAAINAKTSIIQVQDRTLELRLRQLDTEQKALATEMDVVKGVIKSNIESTFKTFS